MKYKGIVECLKKLELPNSEEIEFYQGFFSNVYEEFSKISFEDLDFYKRQAAISRGEILELACGSGRVTMPLLECGHAVTGIDLSESMLSILKNKISKKSKRIKERCKLIQEDICNFDISNKFNLAILPATTISLLYEEDVLNMFNCVYNSLLPNGHFIFDIRLIDESKFVDGATEPVYFKWDDECGNKNYVIMQEFLDYDNKKAVCNFYGEINKTVSVERKFSFTEKYLIRDEDVKRYISNTKFQLINETCINIPGGNEKIKLYILRK